MERKYVKLIVYGAFVVITFIIVYIWTQREGKPDDGAPMVYEQTENSRYDDKIQAYREMERAQRMVVTNNDRTSYFEADSILTRDGKMVANPDKKDLQVTTQENLFGSQDRQFREAEDRLTQAQQRLGSVTGDDQGIVYQVAQGKRIYYDKNGHAYTKDGTIDERAMGQAAVDQYLAAKAEAAPAPPPETEAQRKKRRIEESMGIRTKDGTQIPAVVHTTQVVGNGQEAVFRVTQDTHCGNLLIPQHTLLAAQVKISGNRVHFSVGSLRLAGRYYVVSLTGYSVDGGEGLALNISSEKKALDSEVKDAALSGIQRVIGATTVGSAVTGIVRGVSRASDRETETTVKLIDNQPINFFVE